MSIRILIPSDPSRGKANALAVGGIAFPMSLSDRMLRDVFGAEMCELTGLELGEINLI